MEAAQQLFFTTTQNHIDFQRLFFLNGSEYKENGFTAPSFSIRRR